jgi:hypothetical protein
MRMAIRSALAALTIAALALLVFPPSFAVACPPEDDCGGVTIYGPQGPEAFQDLSTGLYTFGDGSTSSEYDPPSWSPPSFLDYVDRAISSFEGLFEAPEPGSSGSGIRN